MTKETEREEQESSLAAMARYSGHGLTLAVSMVVFLMLGFWADGKLGTSPALTLIGAFVGAAAGFYSMLQHLILAPRARERAEAEAGQAEGGLDDGRPAEGGRARDEPADGKGTGKDA
jgi:F0F1-type ATP synthase assembly protein I